METGEGTKLVMADGVMDGLTGGEIARGARIPGWTEGEGEAFWQGVAFGVSEAGNVVETLAECLYRVPGSEGRAKTVAALVCLLAA